MNTAVNRTASLDRTLEVGLEEGLNEDKEITRPVRDQFTAPRQAHLRPVATAQPEAPMMEGKLKDTLEKILKSESSEPELKATTAVPTTKTTGLTQVEPARYSKGEYAGMTKEEAVSKELAINTAMPSERLKKMRENTIAQIDHLEEGRRKLTAEKKVQTTSLDAEFEDRSERLRNEIEEHKAAIAKLQEEISDNEHHRKVRMTEISSKYDIEISSLATMINAQQLMLTSLADNVTPSKQVEHQDA